jgi:formate hydrogenlyase subunit 6/NADH:ubiquinone oxidoreductase subunit I
MKGAEPWLPRPGDCICCALCVFVCPAEAIHMAAGETADVRLP